MGPQVTGVTIDNRRRTSEVEGIETGDRPTSRSSPGSGREINALSVCKQAPYLNPLKTAVVHLVHMAAKKRKPKSRSSPNSSATGSSRRMYFFKDELKAALAPIQQTLDEHTAILAEHSEILNEHTRDLNIIKKDVERNLDKRLTLEVRVTNIEKKVFGASQEPAHQ